MLGVSGLRGIVGASLTPTVAARFAGAFGSWLRARSDEPPRVVIGADGRAGYEPIHRAAVNALAAAGCRVHDLGVAMTPTVAVVADRLAADGGMVVTASHNPQDWNGLKCLVRSGVPANTPDACAPPAPDAGSIVTAFRDAPDPAPLPDAPAARDPDGARTHARLAAGCLAAHDAHAVRAARPRVLLDSVNASGRDGGRILLAELLGCELVHHGSEPTGVFPHPPEPTKDNLASLCAGVRRFNAAVGFAQDPDGDRLAIVDETGRYVGEEYTLALAAESLLSAASPPGGPSGARPAPASPPILVANLSTSRMIDDIAARHGARVLRTPVGEANVVEAMKRERAAGRDVILGGEGNGGVIWPDVTYVRDSLSAMALVLALMARTGKSVSRLVAEIPSYAIRKDKLDLARKEDAAPACEALFAAYARRASDAPGERIRIDRQDGVRVDFGATRAWLHVRASNTEPIMRLIAEAPDDALAGRVLAEARALMRA